MSKLLIVDDEEEICELLKDFFEDQTDCTILTASTPDAALRIIKDEQPKGVLLDINLKAKRNGFDILNLMRTVSPDTRTIMVTAYNDYQSIQKAKLLGATDYVTKPFTLEYLENTVRTKIADILD